MFFALGGQLHSTMAVKSGVLMCNSGYHDQNNVCSNAVFLLALEFIMICQESKTAIPDARLRLRVRKTEHAKEMNGEKNPLLKPVAIWAPFACKSM